MHRAQKAGQLRKGQLSRLVRSLTLLEGHHSRPYYLFRRPIAADLERSMAWQGSKNKWQERGWAWPKQTKGRDTGTIQGFDGKRIKLEPAAGRDGGGYWYGSQPSQQGAADTAKQLGFLKKCMKELTAKSGVTMPAELMEILSDSEEQKLRDEQKALNQRRKALRRITTLESQIETEKERYGTWRDSMQSMLETEAERFQDKINKLQNELKKAKKIDGDASMEERQDEALELARETMQENSRLQRQLQEANEKQAELQRQQEAMYFQMQQMQNMIRAMPPQEPIMEPVVESGTDIKLPRHFQMSPDQQVKAPLDKQQLAMQTAQKLAVMQQRQAAKTATGVRHTVGKTQRSPEKGSREKDCKTEPEGQGEEDTMLSSLAKG